MATQPYSEVVPDILPILAESPVKKIVPKKKLIRRTGRDYSQQLRRGFQFAFLALNIYLGATFYFWVKAFEVAGNSTITRPAGVEGWLPIAGMMNFKYWVLTGRVPAMHPAAMFLLVTFVAISFLFRKSFCSWLCPVGTISEYLWRAGRKIFGQNLHITRWVDIPLRGLKYVLLGLFVWAVSSMSAPAITAFMRSPYGVIADVKMLDFFRFIGTTGLVVIGLLVVLSILIQNFWCRYLCPYGALMGISALFSPTKIRRSSAACIDCGKCAKACPASLPVDKLVSIKSAECTGCMECVAACPAEGALRIGPPSMASSKPREIPSWAMAAGIAVVFFGVVGFAKSEGYWKTDVPSGVYQKLVPHADEATHPMPGDPALSAQE